MPFLKRKKPSSEIPSSPNPSAERNPETPPLEEELNPIKRLNTIIEALKGTNISCFFETPDQKEETPPQDEKTPEQKERKGLRLNDEGRKWTREIADLIWQIYKIGGYSYAVEAQGITVTLTTLSEIVQEVVDKIHFQDEQNKRKEVAIFRSSIKNRLLARAAQEIRTGERETTFGPRWNEIIQAVREIVRQEGESRISELEAVDRYLDKLDKLDGKLNSKTKSSLRFLQESTGMAMTNLLRMATLFYLLFILNNCSVFRPNDFQPTTPPPSSPVVLPPFSPTAQPVLPTAQQPTPTPQAPVSPFPPEESSEKVSLELEDPFENFTAGKRVTIQFEQTELSVELIDYQPGILKDFSNLEKGGVVKGEGVVSFLVHAGYSMYPVKKLPGEYFRVENPPSTITIFDQEGKEIRFRLVGRVVKKDGLSSSLPLEETEIFRKEGEYYLFIITCAQYDFKSGKWFGNVVCVYELIKEE
jgi:hypothetical protein